MPVSASDGVVRHGGAAQLERAPIHKEGEAMRQLCVPTLLMGFAVICTSPAAADVVVLTNGVEIHNAQIINETDHIVTLRLIGLTRVVLGRSEIARIDREARPSVPPAPGEPVPQPRQPAPAVTPVPSTTPVMPPPPSAPGMTQILKVAAQQPGVTLEFRLDISSETGLRYTVYPSDAPQGSGTRTYTMVATDGTEITVRVSWNSQGDVTASSIEPPTPPMDADQDVYEYTIETIDGSTFKIRAIWDVLNSEIIDINILLL